MFAHDSISPNILTWILSAYTEVRICDKEEESILTADLNSSNLRNFLLFFFCTIWGNILFTGSVLTQDILKMCYLMQHKNGAAIETANMKEEYESVLVFHWHF